VFEGDWVDILNVAMIYVSVTSDVASATDGLLIEYSPDGGTTVISSDEYTIKAGSKKTFSFQAAASHFRVSYTNGGTDQATFALQTIFKSVYGKASSHRIKDQIVEDDDAELSKTVLMTQSSDVSTFRNVDAQYPIPVDGDSVYVKDIELDDSSSVDFTGGTVEDLFNDVNTEIVNSTSNNPKTVEVCFKRAVSTSGVAIGSNQGGNYSNVKVEALRAGGTYVTLVDESANPTKFTARFYSFALQVGNDLIGTIAVTGLRVTFHTTDTISLTSMFVSKTGNTLATLQGVKPDGTAAFIGATNNSNLKVSVQEYGDTPAVDAFARLRTSEPFTLFDSKQLHDKQPLFWDEEIGGSATSVHSSANAETKMSVTTSSSDYVIRQTRQRFNYQPGKSQLIFMTYHSPQATGVTARIGCFDGTGTNNLDPNNGIFFETDGTLSWNIAKNGTITETATQANWNVDPLDGTGRSGITLDPSDTQILIIDFEWLGVGRVRVGFVIDGLIYYVHNFNHANNDFDSVYMSTPNLPLRYDIQTDGTTASHIDHICSTIMSEGGVEKTGILRAVDMGDAYVTGYGTANSYALLGIRLKSAYNDISVIPESLSILLGTNDSFIWRLQLNPTVAGTFTYNDLTDSSVQYAVGALTNTITTPGLVIASGGGSTQTRSASADLLTALRIGSTIAGVRDELVLTIRPLSTNLGVWASASFRELL
jgi:hypothetical protein